jgi:hypothetical protein
VRDCKMKNEEKIIRPIEEEEKEDIKDDDKAEE